MPSPAAVASRAEKRRTWSRRLLIWSSAIGMVAISLLWIMLSITSASILLNAAVSPTTLTSNATSTNTTNTTARGVPRHYAAIQSTRLTALHREMGDAFSAHSIIPVPRALTTLPYKSATFYLMSIGVGCLAVGFLVQLAAFITHCARHSQTKTEKQTNMPATSTELSSKVHSLEHSCHFLFAMIVNTIAHGWTFFVVMRTFYLNQDNVTTTEQGAGIVAIAIMLMTNCVPLCARAAQQIVHSLLFRTLSRFINPDKHKSKFLAKAASPTDLMTSLMASESILTGSNANVDLVPTAASLDKDYKDAKRVDTVDRVYHIIHLIVSIFIVVMIWVDYFTVTHRDFLVFKFLDKQLEHSLLAMFIVTAAMALFPMAHHMYHRMRVASKTSAKGSGSAAFGFMKAMLVHPSSLVYMCGSALSHSYMQLLLWLLVAAVDAASAAGVFGYNVASIGLRYLLAAWSPHLFADIAEDMAYARHAMSMAMAVTHHRVHPSGGVPATGGRRK